MVHRRAIAGVAVAAWAGATAIVVASFADGFADTVPRNAAVSRLCALLIAAAVVSTVTYVIDKRVITPLLAYKCGIEAGERRERRRGLNGVTELETRRRAGQASARRG